jgi:hypothetical protein
MHAHDFSPMMLLPLGTARGSNLNSIWLAAFIAAAG